MTSFDQLFHAHRWRPIPNCPGRYVAKVLDGHMSVADLVGSDCQVRTFKTEKARDTVLVTKIDGGGLISYLRADGTLLHTLNTESGFNRKLADLGLEY